MKKIPKIIISIILLGVLFLGIWQIAQAHGLLIEYPTIPGASKPGLGGVTEKETTDLPEIIKYIYMFSLGIVGVIALLFILIGAIMYIFSAGKPDKARDAKDRIFSAILGIIILLASVIILRTINPDLVNIGFKLPEIKSTTTPQMKNVACYCLTERAELIFQNRCHTSTTECTSPCVDLCQPAGWVGICKTDTNKCP